MFVVMLKKWHSFIADLQVLSQYVLDEITSVNIALASKKLSFDLFLREKFLQLSTQMKT